MRKIVFSLIASLLAGFISAQNLQVTGIATAADDSNPMIGVAVAVQGTNGGTITDIDGAYSISAPSNGTLVFSFMGYETLIVPVNGRKVINVTLSPGSIQVDDVVITAMGISREKKALGYAVQDIKSDELVQAAAASFSSALQGKVSGVDITPSSGMPGASAKITIRGSRSFDGNNTPLYVVDGMPVASTPDLDTGSSVTGSDYASRSLDIDPNDIESINILKGQAASALYGMRASNGVIIITTKKGSSVQKGAPRVTFTTNLSFDKVSVLPDFQTKYAQGSAGRFSPTSSTSWGPKISDLADDPDYGGNTDNIYTQEEGMHEGMYFVPQREKAGLSGWAYPQAYGNAKEFFKTGTTWGNSLSVAKNSDKSSIIFAIGNTSSTGIVESTGLNRYNARMAADTELSRHFDLGFSANYVMSNLTKMTGANDGVVATVYGSPASYDLAGIPSNVAGDPYTQNTYRSTSGFDAAYWAVNNNEFRERSQRFFGNAHVGFHTDFASSGKHNMTVKYQLGEDAYSTNYSDIFGYGHANGKGEISEISYTSNEVNSLFTVDYTWKINGDWNFEALYGNEFVYGTRKEVDSYGMNFNYGGFNHMSNVSSYQGSEYFRKNLTAGNFLNISADFKDMLFLNATGRVDRVSSMPDGNRTFFYPSVSAGFIFTELEAFQNEILTFGKIRASYAEVGQAGVYIDSYYTTPGYGGGFSSGTPVMYPINTIVAFTPSSTIYDPNLKPQNTRSYEFGLDLAFYEGRISLGYTYSRQNVKDQIFAVPVPSSTGYSSFVTNGGKMHTDAHELTFSASPVRTRNFEWRLGVNFTKIDNYVDELADGVESIFLGGFTDPQVRAGIGDKYPVIYGTAFLRNDDGDIVVGDDGMPLTGPDGVIGRVSPDFTMGFSTGITYKQLNFNAVFEWKNGGQMYYGSANTMDYYGVTQHSADLRDSESFLFEWPAVKITGKDSEGNNTYATNDIMIPGDMASDYLDLLSTISEAAIFDASFLKLREISLSYRFVNNPKFGLSANLFTRNILLWSGYKGFDPESSQGNNNMAGGFERFSLPASTSFGAGLTFNF